MIPEDVAWGLLQLQRRRTTYDLYLAYYEGRHRLAFLTERMQDAFGQVFREYSLNLCGTVVDAHADRLAVLGFSMPGAEAEGAGGPAQQLWERNHMPYRHGQVHRRALAMGDYYLHVWQDEAGLVRIYDEDPRQVVGHPDPAAPGDLDYAVKAWAERGRVRVTVYYRDRVERYAARDEGTQLPSADQLRPLRATDVKPGADGRAVVVNPWGQVPLVHLAHTPGPSGLGTSLLRDVKPPQDALNKTVADLLAGGEVLALPWRFLIGYEPERRPDGTAIPLFQEKKDRVVTLPKGASVQQLEALDPGPLLAVKAEHAADVARVGHVPVHTLMLLGANDWPSGEALRVAESRQVAHDTNLVAAWGPQWARCMGLALRMAQGGTTEVRTLWGPVATPPSAEDAARTAEAKQRAGIPREQTWREMGYSEQQIAQFTAAFKDEQARQADLTARAFNAGEPLATGGV